MDGPRQGGEPILVLPAPLRPQHQTRKRKNPTEYGVWSNYMTCTRAWKLYVYIDVPVYAYTKQVSFERSVFLVLTADWAESPSSWMRDQGMIEGTPAPVQRERGLGRSALLQRAWLSKLGELGDNLKLACGQDERPLLGKQPCPDVCFSLARADIVSLLRVPT